MTVKELKQVLNNLDEDKNVVIISVDDTMGVFAADIECVFEGTFYNRERDSRHQIKRETSEQILAISSEPTKAVEEDTRDSYWFAIDPDNTLYQNK